jgi:hypothetical protein
LHSYHLKCLLSFTDFIIIQLIPSKLTPSTSIQKLPEVLSPELEEWVSSQVDDAIVQVRLKVLLIFLYLKSAGPLKYHSWAEQSKQDQEETHEWAWKAFQEKMEEQAKQTIEMMFWEMLVSLIVFGL